MMKLAKRCADCFYVIFRVIIGLLFFQHGAQKLLGWFGGFSNPVQLFSLMGLAGTIELFGGLLIVLGIFTRLAALISGIEMLVAFAIAHLPNGLIPLLNGGELALVYFATFLILFVSGAGKWSLEKQLFKKELF